MELGDMRLHHTFIWIALSSTACKEATEPWPTGGWESSSPEAQGLDGAVLEAIHQEFEEGKHGYVDGMLLVRHGRVIFERAYRHDYDEPFEGRGVPGMYNYYDPSWHPYYQRGSLHTLQSVSKSVTSALIGIAIARGEIPGVEVAIVPYFTPFKLPETDARREAITLHHLLTMTAGIRWDESTIPYTDPANSCALMEASEDWVQFVLDQPMADEPGAVWVYNSGVTELLSFVLKMATGHEAHDYAAEHLFGPLGIDSHFWKRTPTGLADTEGGLYLAPRDLAKIGYLYLKDGVWEGRRILPEGWVKTSTTPSVNPRLSRAPGRRYGYQWWLLPRAEAASQYAYAALGYGGQYLMVVPELELIAVFTGWNIYDTPPPPPEWLLERLLAAVKDRSSSVS
jgi:CubicO group peptidase (beta-lactamase class C family)